MSGWTWAASFPLLLAGFVIWLGAGWISWNQWKRHHFSRSMGLLESFRIVIVTLLIFTLFKPERVREIERKNKAQIIILHDSSASMETRDVVVSDQVFSRKDWVKRILESEFYAPLKSTSRVEIVPFANPSDEESALSGTDLSRALENVLQRFEDIKGVILLSDGDWNLGLPPIGVATRYRDRQTPIFPVAVGRNTALPDLAIDDFDAPAYGLLGEQISIPIRIRNDFSQNISTTIRLLDDQKDRNELSKKTIDIPAQSVLQEAMIWEPRKVGERALILKIDSHEGEVLEENNLRSFPIHIRLETLKVLIVDSKPRWEYRYLRNALARDPGVQMHCLLFHPGLKSGAGRHYLPSFPKSKDQIALYDVIFLGDVGLMPNQLKEADLELIRGLISQQASGLVFLPGRSGHQQTLTKSPLGDLFPVILNEDQPEGIGLQNESRLRLSALGRGHWLTRFDADERKNDELWKQLPGFYWSASVEKSRPGTDVLAVHSSIRNAWGRIPLLATRPFGSGKVLFMGSDSAWRWRRGVEDKYHYRFWSQVVRWMAHQRHLSETEGIRLGHHPEVAELGDTLFLQASVLDRSGYPAQSGNVLATLTRPSGRTEKLDFTLSEGGWGVYHAEWIPEEDGIHEITIRAEEHGRKLETNLQVMRPMIEKIGRPIARQTLAEIASITRGRLTETRDLSGLIASLESMPEPKLREHRLRLWANVWWGTFLLTLLTIYWITRKILGLI